MGGRIVSMRDIDAYLTHHARWILQLSFRKASELVGYGADSARS